LFLPIGLKLAMIFHWSISVFVDWTEACNDLSRLFAFANWVWNRLQWLSFRCLLLCSIVRAESLFQL
jgi:hypothetical protein